MSFQGYMDTIHARTGKTADDFRAIAETRGLMSGRVLKPAIKAGAVLDWLREDFNLVRGHGMAIYALLKGMKTP